MEIQSIIQTVAAVSASGNIAWIVSFLKNRKRSGMIVESTGELITELGKFIQGSDKSSLQDMFADASTLTELINNANAASKYKGIVKIQEGNIQTQKIDVQPSREVSMPLEAIKTITTQP